MATNDAMRVEAFYNRWKAPVYRVCLVFLGGEGTASECTARAFFDYIRQDGSLELTAMPARLLGLALSVVRERCAVASKPNGEASNLTEGVLMLPCEQRAVLILRSVLGLSVEAISDAMGLGSNRARSLCFQAALRLRELVPKEFFEERRQ